MASMRSVFSQAFDRGEKRRLAGFFGGVAFLHLVGWGLLLAYAANHPGFLWLGGIASDLLLGRWLARRLTRRSVKPA